MKKDVVTIVLSIYNVEKYLERCINSVVNQTYKNLEIILVDDGATDSCPQICDEWAKKDSRIKVIHKKNAGLGMARNTGIENANGEYICFFDSDDYITLDAIEKLVNIAKKEKSDIVTFGFSRVDRNGNITEEHIPTSTKVTYTGDEICNDFLADMIAPQTASSDRQNLWMSAWASFYSLELIKKANWRFVSEREIISEDVYSLLHLYKHLDRVSVLSESLYFYCENDASLTHTYRSDRVEKIRNFYDSCNNAAKDMGYGDKVFDALKQPYISFNIAALKMIITSDEPRKKEIFKDVILNSHLQNVVKSMDLSKENIKMKVFLFAIKHKLWRICHLLIKLQA